MSHGEFLDFQRDLIAVHDALFFLNISELRPIQRGFHKEALLAAQDAVNKAHAVRFQFLRAHTRVSMLAVAPAIAALRAQLERAPDSAAAVRTARKSVAVLTQVGEAVPFREDRRRAA